MKIAIFGTGQVGRALAGGWSAAGHEIVLGSRDPQRPAVRELVAELGDRVRADGWAGAARAGDVLVLAVPWIGVRELLASIGDLGTKTVIDCTNPLNAGFTGLELGFSTSAAETIAGWARGGHVVKSLNTASAATMANPRYGDRRATMFYCGDDDAARGTVRELVGELGFEPVDAGPLVNARYLEPFAMLYIYLAVRGGWGSSCAFHILKR